jgi:nicotinamide-nucleotide amidase
LTVAIYSSVVLYYFKSKSKGVMVLKAEILAVGTEILLGDIVNTNAQFLAKELANMGITVQHQAVVGDNPQRLKEAMEQALSRSDILITSGGLGPTQDDITKEMAAEVFGKKMYLHQESMDRLKEHFKGRYMAETNNKQAYMPEGSIVLKNNNGTAPGCIIEENGKIIIVLPGPPREIKPMFTESVIPFLAEKTNCTLLSKEIHIVQVGESRASEVMDDIIKNSTNPTVAPYAKDNEMLFRVTARGKDKAECEKIMEPVVNEIYNRLGDYIYGEDDETLVSSIMKILEERKWTLATAESCTGGMVASRIVDYAGASKAFVNGMVTYTNESKSRLLGVKCDTLEKWGAVSSQTAEEMCLGVAKVSNTNVGISTTGVAGPGGGTAEKPVGLVYIGVAINGKATVERLDIHLGSRNRIRSYATARVLALLRQELLKSK